MPPTSTPVVASEEIAPSVNRAPQTNVTKLNAAVVAIEDLKREIRANKEQAESREKVLYAAIEVLKAKLSVAESRILCLVDYVGMEETGEEGAMPGESSASGSQAVDDAVQGTSRAAASSPGGDDDEPEGVGRPRGATQKEIKHSEEVVKGAPIKLVINVAFLKLMGVTKLTGPELPHYPPGLDVEDAEWPTDARTGQKLLRFKWHESISSRTNTEGIEKVVAWIQASGKETVPRAAKDLAEAHTFDLTARVKVRWGYLAKAAKRSQKTRGAGEGPTDRHEQSDDDGDFDGPERGSRSAVEGDGNEQQGGTEEAGAVQKATAVSRSVLRSRAEAKLKQRKRKRVGSQYTDAKYDAAFIINAMSDDEDDPASTVDGKATRYLSCAPGYRSNDVQDLYDCIDGLRDPNPDKERKLVPRGRGASKRDAEPPRANRLSTRIRAWQVNPAYLQDHPEWLTSGRVAMSGKAWGDLEDPQEDEKPVVKRAGEGDSSRRKVRRVENVADVAQAQAQLERVAGGKDIKAMFLDE